MQRKNPDQQTSLYWGKNRWEFTCNSLIYLEIYSRDREDVVLMTEKELLQIWKWGY